MANRTMHEFEFCLTDAASPGCRFALDRDTDGGGARRPCAQCPVQRSLQSGRREIVEVRGQRADGSPYWATHCALPYRDDQGVVVGHIVVIEDITQRKEDARALQEGEERFRSIAEAASDAIVVADSAGTLVYWNNGATNTFGYTAAEAIGMPLAAIVPQHHRQAHEAGVARAAGAQARHGGSRRAELTALHKDGHEFPIDLSVSTWRASDGLFISGIVRDITERRRFEQALIQAKEQADASARVKSEFLANMSHEIRTPMNAILGLTHLMRRDQPTAAQRDRLVKIDSSCRHLLAIINDILDLAKIEAGRFELESTDFHLASVLDGVASIVREAITEKGLELQVDTDSVPMWLRGDPTRLRQALLNYVGNAVKFTERGVITMSALLLDEDDGELHVRFEVADTGAGIAADKQHLLFSEFEQTDSSTTRRHGGTGLGLAITRRLARLMGGEVGMRSVAGVGSRFWFTARLRRGKGVMPLDAGAALRDAEPWSACTVKRSRAPTRRARWARAGMARAW